MNYETKYIMKLQKWIRYYRNRHRRASQRVDSDVAYADADGDSRFSGLDASYDASSATLPSSRPATSSSTLAPSGAKLSNLAPTPT